MYFFSRGHTYSKTKFGRLFREMADRRYFGSISSWSNAHHKFYPNLNLVSSWYLEKCEQYAES